MLIILIAVALLVLLGLSMLIMPLGKAHTRRRNAADQVGGPEVY